MNEELKAKQLFHKYYCLFMDQGGEVSEEIIVSVLSIKCAVIACEEVLKHDPINPWPGMDATIYWKKVIEILKEM